MYRFDFCVCKKQAHQTDSNEECDVVVIYVNLLWILELKAIDDL